jgi:ATP/maltotriose-dependent transcriptional regulator MalT
LILAAWRGQVPEARTLIGSAARQATARGAGIGVAVSEYSHAVACNSRGQSAEAFAAVRAACADPAEMLVRNWAMPELVEAAARGGGTELAAATAARLSARARACGSNWALGIAACSRALVSDGDGAEDSFRAAVDYLSRTRARGALARAHLLYGEWLRQRNRRAAARRELTQSHEMFTAMGMDGFAERARRELVAAGTAFGEGTAEAVDRLTEQEALIARLARDGRSNPEIGAQLFLSARTVEWHLRKVYSKLGISSRRQLRRALDA